MVHLAQVEVVVQLVLMEHRVQAVVVDLMVHILEVVVHLVQVEVVVLRVQAEQMELAEVVG
jgi:hypothetical protein